MKKVKLPQVVGKGGEANDEEPWKLTKEDLDKLAQDNPLLDFSMLDDYRKEYEVLMEASTTRAFKAGISEGGRICEVVSKRAIAEAVKQERERLLTEIGEMLGIPKSNKPFQMTVTIFSEWWQSLSKGKE